MEDYLKAKMELIKEKDRLTERLVNILVKHDIAPYRAWFNWSKDRTIVWGNCNISMDVLDDLSKEFGEIKCVYSPKMSDNLFIRFKGDK